MAETEAAVADLAEGYFDEGHNCAMSVLRAVAERAGLSCPACVPGIALALGGGVGHTGHICGALTGAAMAIGLAADRRVSGSVQAKKDEANRLAGDLVARFAERFGAAACRSIIGFDWSEPGAIERFRRENVKAEKCVPCVRWASAEALTAVESLT